MRKKILIVASVVITLSLIGYISLTSITKASDRYNYEHDVLETSTTPYDSTIDDTYNNPSAEYDNNNSINEDADMSDYVEEVQPWSPDNTPDLNPFSITVLVNQEHALPRFYVPENMVVPNILFDISRYDDKKLLRKEAATAIELLFQAAEQRGYTLYGVSGYRSYERQHKIFTTNLVVKGKTHTLKYSAVPGTSEHQTGLAMDVSTKSLGYKLITSFATTPEGIWLAENAHHYGFIVRYSKDKTDITGYAYEPWHIRYVGKGLATYLYEHNLTLEEYYNYTPSDSFNFETAYATILNYKPPVTEVLEEMEEIDELELEEIYEEEPVEEVLPEPEPTVTPIPEKPKKKKKKPVEEITPTPEVTPIEEIPTEVTDQPDNNSSDNPDAPEVTTTPTPDPGSDVNQNVTSTGDTVVQ